MAESIEGQIEEAYWEEMEAGQLPRSFVDGIFVRQAFDQGYRKALRDAQKRLLKPETLSLNGFDERCKEEKLLPLSEEVSIMLQCSRSAWHATAREPGLHSHYAAVSFQDTHITMTWRAPNGP